MEGSTFCGLFKIEESVSFAEKQQKWMLGKLVYFVIFFKKLLFLNKKTY